MSTRISVKTDERIVNRDWSITENGVPNPHDFCYCIDSPKEVLKKLLPHFFIVSYQGLNQPVDRFNNPPAGYKFEEGIEISTAITPIGTKIVSTLDELITRSILKDWKQTRISRSPDYLRLSLGHALSSMYHFDGKNVRRKEKAFDMDKPVMQYAREVAEVTLGSRLPEEELAKIVLAYKLEQVRLHS